MGDLLTDGTISGYEGYCSKCGKIIKTNMQGNEIGEHECSVPVAEQSMGTMFDENYKKLKEQQCSHPDIGTDGGGDYCKRCGKRW